jgi:hypothetical protein
VTGAIATTRDTIDGRMSAMKKVAILLLAATALTACGHGYPRHRPPAVIPPPPDHPPPYRPIDTVSPAIAMCDVETLAEQRLDMLEEVHSYREAIRAEPGHRSDMADTETQEIIAAFETDLDASYRFATASCRTYNRCLEENRFEEAACRDSAEMWHDGQDRFHDLSERLSLVRERVASECYDCRIGRDRHHGYRDGDRYHDHDRYSRHHRRHDPDDLMGSVFSTSDH